MENIDSEHHPEFEEKIQSDSDFQRSLWNVPTLTTNPYVPGRSS
jgi:hypothetical protein